MSRLSVGITSYGTYIPSAVLPSEEIARAHQSTNLGPALGVLQKTVPAKDEDTATIAVAASLQAKQRAKNPQQFTRGQGVLFIGSESHPYAVKPTGTIVHQALNLSPYCASADMQFACKAGTQALQACCAYVQSGMAEYGLAVGADTAQAESGDVLEFTAAAGGAAFFIGKKNIIATLLDTCSYMSDTPDFWRRPLQSFPQHSGRFTGEPAYFAHVLAATRMLLEKLHAHISDFDHCIFHTPNGKFPTQVAQRLGCTPEQMQYSLVVKQIGNTYAGASMLALASVLDHANAGDKILLTSYGSGAGADSFAFECTAELVQRRKKWLGFLDDSIASAQPITFEQYMGYHHI